MPAATKTTTPKKPTAQRTAKVQPTAPAAVTTTVPTTSKSASGRTATSRTASAKSGPANAMPGKSAPAKSSATSGAVSATRAKPAATHSADTSPKANARAHPPPLPPPSGVHLRSPASRSARDLFEQAGHELSEAATATHVYDRYCGAHIAALRAAAAVVSARSVPAPPGRRRPRSVWDLLYRSAPELADWAAYFASGATRRAAAEAGLPNAVTAQEATDLIREAEVFLGVVAELLGIAYQDGLLFADPAEHQQAS